MLAHRTSLFASSGTAAARALAKAASDTGNEIIDLTAGEILCDLAPTIRRGAIDAINRGVNRYTDTLGMAELRESIARKLARDTGQIWKADEVAVTSGAKQALFNAAMVLFDPGDEVIVPAPYWTTFPAQVRIAGATAVHVDTRDGAYKPRIEDLRAAITPATRAIIVNSPNNPTGAVYDRELLAAIAKLAIEAKLWVISDECYGAFVHDAHAHESILSVVPEIRPQTLIVNAFSKSLALTGWRLGYLAGPKDVVNAIKALQSHTTSNPNVIAQHAVLAYLDQGDAAFDARLRAQIALSRQRGLQILSGLKRVPMPAAQGGFYFYLDLSDLLRSSPERSADDVARELLIKAGVAGVSGTAFGDPMGLRLSYGMPVQKLERGLGRLVDCLNSLA